MTLRNKTFESIDSFKEAKNSRKSSLEKHKKIDRFEIKIKEIEQLIIESTENYKSNLIRNSNIEKKLC